MTLKEAEQKQELCRVNLPLLHKNAIFADDIHPKR